MKRLRQIVAMLTVILIVALLIATVICAITGSKYFFGMLFLTIAVPVVLWVFMWFTHLLNGNQETLAGKDMELSEQTAQENETAL